jgi:hypothetical protein
LRKLLGEYEKRLRALTSTAGRKHGLDWQRIVSEEAAWFEERLRLHTAHLGTGIAKKLTRAGLPPSPHLRFDFGADGLRTRRRRPPRPSGRRPEAGGVPVRPDRPSRLSGGAAVFIERD